MGDAGDLPFERMYERAGSDLAAVPWALLEPHPALVGWLDTRQVHGGTALVVGCGLGDDAQELASRGWRTTAFDVAPTAIDRCRQRFPRSPVTYAVADLFALPGAWSRAFDLVVEIRTVQSLPLWVRAEAMAAIAATVAPGGRLFVRTLARDDDAVPGDELPIPLTRGDLDGFVLAGLDEVAVSDEPPTPTTGRAFTAEYVRR